MIEQYIGQGGFPVSALVSKTMRYLLLLILIAPFYEAAANVPVRVSVKFFVDVDGNRPPETGNYSSDEQVLANMELGNNILYDNGSELQIDIIEMVDLPTSLSHLAFTPINDSTRDWVQDQAKADSDTWKWRSSAINIYVFFTNTGTPGIGDLPEPLSRDNNIILIGQRASDVTLLHEVGHNLYLMHTHEDAIWGFLDDDCDDTIHDKSDWTSIGQMARDNYGKDYAQLSATEKNNVDMTWYNVMSYHKDGRYLLTRCQTNRMSKQAYSDKAWLLNDMLLVYVNIDGALGCLYDPYRTCVGSFSNPFFSLQTAYDFGYANVPGVTYVMEHGTHQAPAQLLNTNSKIYTRGGISTVNKDRALYHLPDLVNSKNASVRVAIKSSQHEATLGRKALKEAKENAKAMVVDPDAIMILAREKKQKHDVSIIQHFLQAEKHAVGDEKIAIQLGLARKYFFAKKYKHSLKYYNQIAADTEQIGLKKMALRHAEKCKQKIAEGKKESQINGEDEL